MGSESVSFSGSQKSGRQSGLEPVRGCKNGTGVFVDVRTMGNMISRLLRFDTLGLLFSGSYARRLSAVCIREFTLGFSGVFSGLSRRSNVGRAGLELEGEEDLGLGRVGLELEDEEGVGLGRVGLVVEDDEEGSFPAFLVFRDLVGVELEDAEPSLAGIVQTELGFLITVSKGQ